MGNMIALGIVLLIALIIGGIYLAFRPKEHVDASPLRECLNAFSAALQSEHATWNPREQEGSPPINTDTETGLFSFLSPDGTIHALYEATGLTATLKILCGEHQVDAVYAEGSVSLVTFDHQVLPNTHADVRHNSVFFRKIRSHVRHQVGFRVAPEELEEAPKEFAKPTGKTIDYGRPIDRKKKKRPKRPEPTTDE